MNEDIESQPYDDRHNTVYNGPYGELKTQPAPIFEDGAEELRVEDRQESTSFFRPVFDDNGAHVGEEINHPHARRPEFPGMPSRVPGQNLFNPPPPMPAFDTGLSWVSPDGTVRHNLANFPWASNRQAGVETSNIELRTMYAHLIEAATLARAEMRERGMQVDL